MTMTIKYDTTDYMAIARLVNDATTDEGGAYEVEYAANGYALILSIAHAIEYREEIGGSYVGYDFERLAVVDSEGFDVEDAGCYDADGNEIDTDFDANTLLTILND